MATTQLTTPPETIKPDLLTALRQSRILSEKQVEDLRGKIYAGLMPGDPVALARRLVEMEVLTQYQASRLLHNKAQGFVVGRYVILDRLGAGAMARVYKARHVMMDRVVALKIIAPEYVSSPRKVARFQREIRLIGRLDHPHVVRAFDADRVGNVPYIAMEFIAGQTLGDRLLARGPMRPEEVIEYMAQAALGLDHAHQQGVVHRDVKPSNLFLGANRQVKVLDFGLGVLMEPDSEDSFATRDGIAVGTIDFMSPEQTCGKEIDGRSDIYSLGCSMYHLMTKKLLFPGSSTIERMANRIKGHKVPIASMHPEFPPPLTRVMEKMLATNPDDRFQTAKEAADALRTLGPKKSAPAPVSRPEPEPASHETSPHPSTNGTVNHSEGLSFKAGQPAAALPLLFQFLIFLAEQPVWSLALGALGVLATAFLSGFGVARLFH